MNEPFRVDWRVVLANAAEMCAASALRRYYKHRDDTPDNLDDMCRAVGGSASELFFSALADLGVYLADEEEES